MDRSHALEKVVGQLQSLTRMDVRPAHDQHFAGSPGGPDFELHVGPHLFLVAYKARSATESVGSALLQMKSWDGYPVEAIPLLVVPYMTHVGRRLCDDAALGWMDLSGNADIAAPGVHVNVRGRPNLYPSPGRPQNIFAWRAARLARALLTFPERAWSHQELVHETGLSKGYVSKLLPRYLTAGFLVKVEGQYRPRDLEAMLNAWRESYDFGAHRILKGHVAERTPDAVFGRIVHGVSDLAARSAITGLGAAWYYNQHAAFRLCALYVTPLPDEQRLADSGFRHVDSGANVWLIEPADESVFKDVRSADGLPYVSPLQAYLDLKGHPERAEEAAEVLRPVVLHGVHPNG